VVFIERALSLLHEGGRMAFIIPFSYAIQKYAALSRKLLLEKHTIDSIADLRTVRVFGKVPVITIIPVLTRRPADNKHTIHVLRPGPKSTRYACDGIVASHEVSQAELIKQHESMWRLDLSQTVNALVGKIQAISFKLDDICYINYGAQMSSKKKGAFGKEYVIRDKRQQTDDQRSRSLSVFGNVGRQIRRLDICRQDVRASLASLFRVT
jgi:hypothetical protein